LNQLLTSLAVINHSVCMSIRFTFIYKEKKVILDNLSNSRGKNKYDA